MSLHHSIKNRRAVGLLNPMRDKIEGKNRGEETTPVTHGLSRSWKVEVGEEKKSFMSCELCWRVK